MPSEKARGGLQVAVMLAVFYGVRLVFWSLDLFQANTALLIGVAALTAWCLAYFVIPRGIRSWKDFGRWTATGAGVSAFVVLVIVVFQHT